MSREREPNWINKILFKLYNISQNTHCKLYRQNRHCNYINKIDTVTVTGKVNVGDTSRMIDYETIFVYVAERKKGEILTYS